MAKVASQVLRDLRTDKKEELDIEAFVDKVRDVIERAFRCYGSHGGTGEERVGVCVIVQKVGGRLLAAGRSPVEARLEDVHAAAGDDEDGYAGAVYKTFQLDNIFVSVLADFAESGGDEDGEIRVGLLVLECGGTKVGSAMTEPI